MGKTNPTIREVVRADHPLFEDFRRGLRRQDQQAFDRMVLRVLSRRDALHMANPVDAIQFGLFAAMVGYERELERLAERVEDLEAAVDGEVTP